MWDSLAFQGSIAGTAVSGNRPGVSTVASRPERLRPDRHPSRPLLLLRTPPAGNIPAARPLPIGASRVLSSQTIRGQSASPFRRPSSVATRRRTPQSHATGTKPMKVAARRPLLPPVVRFFLVSHTPLHGPFTGWRSLLSIGFSGPSCASRHLFRRHHLRLQPGLASRARCLSSGFLKIAPPLYAAEESTPTGASLQPLRDVRSHRSSLFHLRGLSPP